MFADSAVACWELKKERVASKTYQMKSLQWQQKVGCLKNLGMNLWSFTCKHTSEDSHTSQMEFLRKETSHFWARNLGNNFLGKKCLARKSPLRNLKPHRCQSHLTNVLLLQRSFSGPEPWDVYHPLHLLHLSRLRHLHSGQLPGHPVHKKIEMKVLMTESRCSNESIRWDESFVDRELLGWKYQMSSTAHRLTGLWWTREVRKDKKNKGSARWELNWFGTSSIENFWTK